MISDALRDIWPNWWVDVVHLNEVDQLLKMEAVSRGQLLYGDILDFDEFRLLVSRMYKDQEDLRKLEVILIGKKLDRLKVLLGG